MAGSAVERPPTSTAVAPYRGLAPYTENDGDLFFGRTTEQRTIAANLLSARLTIVYGPSGVGKSSVLRAGVVADLHRRALEQAEEEDAPGFAVAVVHAWRDDPVAAVEAEVGAAVRRTLGRDDLPDADHDSDLVDVLRHWSAHIHGKLLVVLDQFEEYFLYHERDRGPGTFDDAFPRAVTSPDVRANFLISIREDALARLDRFKGRVPHLFDNRLRVAHLPLEAAREAIRRPLDEYNRRASGDEQIGIEDELVEDVLRQVRTGRVAIAAGGVGSVEGSAVDCVETPFLQIVMIALWEAETRAGQHVLRASTFHKLGGAESIARSRLDKRMGRLNADEQFVAAEIFQFLVTRSGAKIAHTAEDLAEFSELPVDRIEPVVETLSAGDARILRPVGPPAGVGLPRYEIFHDVLGPAVLDWRSRFREAAQQARAHDELARRLEAEKAAKRAADERARQERRRTRRARAVALAMALLGAASLVFALQARWARSDAASAAAEADANAAREARTATEARSQALAQQALASLGVDPARGLALAVQANDVTRTPASDEALRTALAASRVRRVLQHDGGIIATSFSPDGRLVVTASYDETARLWDARSGQMLHGLRHDGEVVDAEFSPDGRQVVTASWDGTARVWDVATGNELERLAHKDDYVYTASYNKAGDAILTAGANLVQIWAPDGRRRAALREPTSAAHFDPSGKLVITASTDGKPVVWDWVRHPRDGDWEYVITAPGGVMGDAAFSPRGSHIAVIAGTGARVYRAGGDDPGINIAAGRWSTTSAIAFSPDGKRVATAGDKEAFVSDVKTGQLLQTLRGHKDLLVALRWSHDGRLLATAGQDGSVFVWRADVGVVLAQFVGHNDVVWSVDFSPDDTRMVTSSVDGTARIWQVAEGRELRGPSGWLLDAEYNEKVNLLVSAGADGTVRRWVVETTGSSRGLEPIKIGSFVRQVAISPDGRRIAAADTNGQVKVFDGQRGSLIAEKAVGSGQSVDFSADGKRLVTTGNQGAVTIWSGPKFGKAKVLLKEGSATVVAAARFDASGRRVVVGVDQRVVVFDAETQERLMSLGGHRGSLGVTTFAPDGSRVVSAGGDQTVRIWDPRARRQERELPVNLTRVADAAFSPDGTLVAAVGASSDVRVWDVASGAIRAVLHPHADTVNSVDFTSDGRSLVTASDDGTVKITPCQTCGSLDELLEEARRRVDATKVRQVPDSEEIAPVAGAKPT